MDDSKTIWCGNLSEKVTEELLYELFLQAGPLERVKIPTDKEGRKSNFAFITFKHEESVNYVLQLLSGTRLFDRNLNIKPRNNNSANKQHQQQQTPVVNDFQQLRMGPSSHLHFDDSPKRFGKDSNRRFHDHSPRRFADNRHGQWDNEHYRDREDRHRDHKFQHQDNDNNHSPNRRRHYQHYNEGRGHFNERHNRRNQGRY